MGFDGESVYNGQVRVKYLLKKARNHSQSLVVSFSGFPSRGKYPTYNYTQVLKNIESNRLYILDDHGEHEHFSKATYYLGRKGDPAVEQSVIDVIRFVAKNLGISFENIIACGSSKGGFASLYYGLKYSFGYVVAGGPQVLLGKYLMETLVDDEGIAEFIAGGTDNKAKEYLNSIIFKAISTSPGMTNVYIHVGQGDHHYSEHVLPLLEALESNGIRYSLDLAEYVRHRDLAVYFPAYLVRTINTIIGQIGQETKSPGIIRKLFSFIR